MNRFLWQIILNAFVLTTRPAKTGANYKKIWNTQKDESPLRTITRGQAERLAERLADLPDVVVDWAMRYGNPRLPMSLTG
jgi:ferrochelatase